MERNYGDGFSDVMMPSFGTRDTMKARHVTRRKQKIYASRDGTINFVCWKRERVKGMINGSKWNGKERLDLITFGREVRGGEMNGVISECFSVKATFWMRKQIQFPSDLRRRQRHYWGFGIRLIFWSELNLNYTSRWSRWMWSCSVPAATLPHPPTPNLRWKSDVVLALWTA